MFNFWPFNVACKRREEEEEAKCLLQKIRERHPEIISAFNSLGASSVEAGAALRALSQAGRHDLEPWKKPTEYRKGEVVTIKSQEAKNEVRAGDFQLRPPSLQPWEIDAMILADCQTESASRCDSSSDTSGPSCDAPQSDN